MRERALGERGRRYEWKMGIGEDCCRIGAARAVKRRPPPFVPAMYLGGYMASRIIDFTLQPSEASLKETETDGARRPS